MSPYQQRLMLREAEYYRWIGAFKTANECLYEVAASIDNPNHVLPKWMRRKLRRKEDPRHDAEKRLQQQQA
jgi:hypothetical protein